MPSKRCVLAASVCAIASLLASTVFASSCSAVIRPSQAPVHFACTVDQLSPAGDVQSACSRPADETMSDFRDSTLPCARPIAPDSSCRSPKSYITVMEGLLLGQPRRQRLRDAVISVTGTLLINAALSVSVAP